MYVCMSVCLSVCLSACLSVCLSVCICMYMYKHIRICAYMNRLNIHIYRTPSTISNTVPTWSVPGDCDTRDLRLGQDFWLSGHIKSPLFWAAKLPGQAISFCSYKRHSKGPSWPDSSSWFVAGHGSRSSYPAAPSSSK